MLQAPQGRVRHATRRSPSAMRRLGMMGRACRTPSIRKDGPVCDVQRVRKHKTSDARRMRTHANRTERTARAACTAHRSRRRSWASSCSSCRTPCDAKRRAVRRAVCPGKNRATRVACDACDASRAYGERTKDALHRRLACVLHVLHTMEHRGRTRTYHESTVAYGVIGHYSAIVADFSPNGISIGVFLYLEVEVKLITIHRNSM